MSTPARRPTTTGKRGGAAAGLLASPGEPAVIEHEGPATSPVGETDLATHQERQRAYREWMAAMSAQTPAQMTAEQAAEATAEATPEPVPETYAQQLARLAAQAKAEYLRRVAEMPPDEPRYVAGHRAPRPKVAGHTLSVGDVVPGAAHFPRLESWVNSGIIVAERA